MINTAIIILTFNSLEEATKPCLESIYSCKSKNKFNVIIVDNHSTDKTREYLVEFAKTHNHFKIIFNDENLGYAAGINIGIKSIDAEYYVLLNNDTIVTDFWLDNLISFLEAHPDVGMVGPVSNSVGNEQVIFIKSTQKKDIIEEGLAWAKNCAGDYFYTEMLGFFCVAIRHNVFEMIGILDEDYGLGFIEDDDFCRRALQKNTKMACLEDVFIYHSGSISFNKLDKEKYENLLLNNINLFERKFNAKYKPRWTNSPFITLLMNYLSCTDKLSSSVIKKITNRISIMNNIDYAQLTVDNFKLFNQNKLLAFQIQEEIIKFKLLTEDYIKIKKQLDETTKQLDETTKQLDETTKQLDETTKQLDETTKQHNKDRVELDNLNDQLKFIVTSDLWIIANILNKIANKIGIIPFVKGLLILKRKGFLELTTAIKINIGSFFNNIFCIIRDNIIKIAKVNNGKNSLQNLTNGIKNKVSIVLPIYNQARYLESAIESVLNQSYQDIELIIINDGSKDDVEKIFDKYINNPKIILLTQENLKLPAALNNGFEYATGEFYTWTSADNIMHLDQVEKLVNYLVDKPDKGMVFSNYQAIDEDGSPLKDPLFRPHNQDPKDSSIMRLPNHVSEHNFHDSGDNFIGPSFMYRRDIAWAIGKYAIDTFGGEDYDYWLRINNLYDIDHIDDVLYKYRVHDNTLSAKAKELNLFDNIKGVLQRDKRRREFLKQDFEYIEQGVSLDLASTSSKNKILLYKYSTVSKNYTSFNMPEEPCLMVCFIDVPPQAIDYELLNSYDLLITENEDQFSYIYPDFKYKTFCFKALENLNEFRKIAKNRLFDKIHLPAYDTDGALVYVNSKLKIALQVDSMDKGGLEQVVLNLIKHLDKNKFDIILVICSNKPGYLGTLLLDHGYNVRCVDKNNLAIENLIKQENIELVNFHYSIFGHQIYKKFNIPMIYTIHNSYTWLTPQQISEREKAFQDMDLFISVSNQVKRYFHSKFKISYERIKTIPNGLDLFDFNNLKAISRTHYGFSDSDFLLINIASFNGLKLHNLMLTALRKIIIKHPQIKFIFVGNTLDAKYYNYILNRIAAEGLKNNVVILNYLSRGEISSLLNISDCFVLPSIQEGWSNAIMEAMYFGLPLILSDTGSARDIIKNNDIGIIIPNPYADINCLNLDEILRLAYDISPKNTEQLASAINEIYENYSVWKKRALKGIEKVNSEYSVGIMAKNYEKSIYETKYIYHKRG